MELRTLRYFVAVAEELHFGRAAARLHMSQPPLSRAIKQLETDLGALLLRRSAAGVTLTPAGATLLNEARTLLDQADQVRVRVAAAAGAAVLTVGMLGDSTDRGATRPAAVYRRQPPGIEVRIRETDLTDPTCGLRAGLVDIALTRAPFDETGLTVHDLRADPVGAVLRGVQECVQAVLWNGTVGMAPLGHDLPGELAVVPLTDMAPSRVVAAWNEGDTNPLIRSFVQIATAAYRH
ncbi:LysR family transcriptional regulator [Streptomyces alanosinicus]|nr:LysR family transcriptional regulator [Streptomyces alanosinicus]